VFCFLPLEFGRVGVMERGGEHGEMTVKIV
jgi:hypothetical protein